MTSISSYYSLLGQESSSLWTNQSDQTYGTIGDGFWRYSDANDAYEERARSSINASPMSRGAANSLEWEFEFGDDAIIYTMGGNDNSSTTNGEDTRRVIFSGKFDCLIACLIVCFIFWLSVYMSECQSVCLCLSV